MKNQNIETLYTLEYKGYKIEKKKSTVSTFEWFECFVGKFLTIPYGISGITIDSIINRLHKRKKYGK
tara:strand:- start:764 stop:964 length:201 start_codon:yes stop_codon:yes gene_type:complete